MSDFAPIILFTYNRLSHTQQAVEALSKNALAPKSDIFIYSDGGKNENDWVAVQRVRDYLKDVTGFKAVTVIHRDRNYGLAASIIDGVTEVINKFGKAIIVEDDIVASPHFLSYMNDALTIYEKEDRVGGVHAYLFPVQGKLPETFFLKYAACWGWGTWKRSWDLFEKNGEVLLRKLLDKGVRDEFDFGGSYPFTAMLSKQIAGKVDSWAIRWQASMFMHDKLILWPGTSLVSNTGHDSSGTHSGSTNLFDVQVGIRVISVQKISLVEDKNARRLFERYFRSLKKRYFSPKFLFYKIIQKLGKIHD